MMFPSYQPSESYNIDMLHYEESVNKRIDAETSCKNSLPSSTTHPTCPPNEAARIISLQCEIDKLTRLLDSTAGANKEPILQKIRSLKE